VRRGGEEMRDAGFPGFFMHGWEILAAKCCKIYCGSVGRKQLSERLEPITIYVKLTIFR
jgi:hypothetical protein